MHISAFGHNRLESHFFQLDPSCWREFRGHRSGPATECGTEHSARAVSCRLIPSEHAQDGRQDALQCVQAPWLITTPMLAAAKHQRDDPPWGREHRRGPRCRQRTTPLAVRVLSHPSSLHTSGLRPCGLGCETGSDRRCKGAQCLPRHLARPITGKRGRGLDAHTGTHQAHLLQRRWHAGTHACTHAHTHMPCPVHRQQKDGQVRARRGTTLLTPLSQRASHWQSPFQIRNCVITTSRCCRGGQGTGHLQPRFSCVIQVL